MNEEGWSSMEGDLRVEREWRVALQEALDQDSKQKEDHIRRDQQLEQLVQVCWSSWCILISAAILKALQTMFCKITSTVK